MAIFICSDWHLNHNKEFVYKARGFSSVEEMNWTIIEKHNQSVTNDDTVYVLGDCCLGGAEALKENKQLISSLKGKLCIVRGNHDTDSRIAMYKECPNVIEVCDGKFLDYKKYHFFLSHYPCLSANNDSNKPLKTRMISVAGHTHTTDPLADWDKGIIFHVEMDGNNCYPWLLDDIINKMKEYNNNETIN